MSEALSAEELALLSEEDIEAARLVFEEELQDRLRSAKYQAMYSLAQMFKQAKAPPQRFVGISPEKLAEYQGQAATIEALQAEVTTLRTALEESELKAEAAQEKMTDAFRLLQIHVDHFHGRPAVIAADWELLRSEEALLHGRE